MKSNKTKHQTKQDIKPMHFHIGDITRKGKELLYVSFTCTQGKVADLDGGYLQEKYMSEHKQY